MTQPVRLDHLAIAVFVVSLFAVLGYRRGILRELLAATAIVLATVISPWLGTVLKPWVNRFYKLAMFARFGGLTSDDLTEPLARLKELPPLIQTADDVRRLGIVLFLLIVALAYLIGQKRVKGPASRMQRVMGAVMGGINGYALFQIVLPMFLTAQFVVVVVPAQGVLQLFHAWLALALVVAFAVLVLFALRLARGKK
ncbi:MAG: CvpA family protein [Anaerolineae bacterium]|nr:CvpA family protein [Anaerolineae bacterium]